MRGNRRTAWVLACTLFASLTFVGPSGFVLAAEPKPQCTGWTDDFHPPPTIRVLRNSGPNAGKVEVVNFWKYVGTVVRTEYSSGIDKPPPWAHIGAITVKQYAWYYAGHWRGGKVTRTNPDGSTTTECYDVKDTTADQIYHPEKKDPVTGAWIAANIPTPANLSAMRATWHMTLRKWQADKNQSRLFLTGYRSGKQRPCGADSTGWKIYQKSLRDCGVKKLTLEETLRKYYEPSMFWVDTRGHDVLADADSWWGDLGVLAPAPTGTQWRLYGGKADGFNQPVVGAFGNVAFGSILGHGSGNVDAPEANGANDARLLADVIMLVNNGTPRLLVARATGNGYAAPTAQDVPAGTGAERLVVADFNGDLMADAGLLSTVSPGVARLSVMRSMGNGTFSAPVPWWTGSLNLAAGQLALPADTNGDGKADLIVRGPAGGYNVALSGASCLNLTVWGPCPQPGPVALRPLATWLAATWANADVKHVVGDYDRDGRDDLIVVLNNNGGIRVLGMRSNPAGGFAQPVQLWAGTVPFADVVPVALDVNPDGMTDLALVQRSGSSSSLMWLRAVERSISPASMIPAGTSINAGFNWSTSLRAF